MTIPSLRTPDRPSPLIRSNTTSDAQPIHHTALPRPAHAARRLNVLRRSSPYPSCALAALLCLLGTTK